ncbi:Uncharacterized protein MCHI_000319 [Candidatus Magnetoovum chiemensis]|nr:Uncharacterized protein MCHI_000319 [Candidatus Magnetoovum chiemensis]
MYNNSTAKSYTYTLIALLGIVSYITFNIIEPFLSAIGWALVLGIVFYPLYAFLARIVKLRLAASFITLFVIVFIIIGPFSYIMILLGSEIKNFINTLQEIKFEKIGQITSDPTFLWLFERMQSIFNFEINEIKSMVIDNISKFGNELASKITHGVTNVLGFVFDFIFTVIILFFLFLDGPRFLKKLWDMLPFSEEQKIRLETDIKDMVISTIYGGIVVALSQGFLAGMVFFALGLHSPILLGISTSVMSFVPVLGAVSIWVPIDILLFIHGDHLRGFILLGAGVFGISIVDNILKPIIISGRTKMPIILVLISVLGGIKFFGLIGLVMGPLMFVLFFALFEFFSISEKADEPPMTTQKHQHSLDEPAK